MIITLIINALFVAVDTILNLFPTGTLPSAASNAFTSLVATSYQFNTVFPIDTLAQLLVLSMSFWGLIYLWKVSKYFLHLVRGN